MYRHPPYELALNKITKEFETRQVTAVIAGVINVTSWKKDYEGWIERLELWQPNSPEVPAFKKGASPDANVMELGDYLPGGLLLIDMAGDDE